MPTTRKIETLENGNVRVTIPIRISMHSCKTKIVRPNQIDGNEPLLITIARGRRWQRLIDDGVFANTIELARAVGRDRSRVSATLRLAMLAPEIIHKVIQGEIPRALTFSRLRQAYSCIWEDQIKELAGEQ